MNIFEILTKNVLRFKRSALLESISQTKLSFDEVTIPALQQTIAAFETFGEKGKMYVDLRDMFYTCTHMNKSDQWLRDWLELITNARQNLNYIEDQSKKLLEAESYSDGMTMNKAYLLTLIDSFEHISTTTTTILCLLITSVDKSALAAASVSKSTIQETLEEARKVFNMLSNYGQPPAKFQKTFKGIPDAMVTSNNKDQVLAAWGKEADPYPQAAQSGFVPNFPLMVVDGIVQLRLWKYNRDKLIKKQIEGRILYLQAKLDGENTAAIESQIANYEKEAEKLQDKIENFERTYG